MDTPPAEQTLDPELCAPSHTVLEGRYALRVANTSHRTRREDFDLLVSEVLSLGRRLVAERQCAAAVS